MAESKRTRLTAAQAKGALENWQRRQLSRFGAALPPVLKQLADDLGYIPHETTAQERALVEDGWWSSGAHWVSHSSPISSQDLKTYDAASAIKFVLNWSQAAGREREDVQGLVHELRKAVSEDIRWGAQVAVQSLRDAAPLGVRSAILEGLRDSLNARAQQRDPDADSDGVGFPWDQALDLISDAFADRSSVIGEAFPEGDQRSYADAAINILMYATSNDVLEARGQNIWELLERGRELPLTWRSDSPMQIQSVEGILVAALNTLSGQLVRATVNVALGTARWDRELAKTTGDHIEVGLVRKVSSALDGFLNHATTPGEQLPYTPAGYGALAMIGEYCPQIAYLASGWLRQNAERLFADVAEPLRSPAWAAFITRSFFSDRVFPIAKPFYLSTSKLVTATKEDGRWSIAEGLGTHALISVLRGFTSVAPEVDEFVATTFTRIPAEDRAHAYWGIYRSWEDHDGPIDVLLVQRLLAFWNWRLNELEPHAASEERSTEAEGLLWFFLTDKVPAELALPSAKRTVLLLGKRATAHLTLFERLAAISQAFPSAALEMTQTAVTFALGSEYRYIPKEPLTIILTAALRSGDGSTKRHATFLVNQLAERTFDTSYLDLLG